MPPALPATSPVSVCVRLTHAIINTQRLDEIYGAALDAIAAGLHVTRAAILLFDSDGVMRFKAWRGLSDAYRAEVEGHTPWQSGAKHVEPIVVPDVTTDASVASFLPAFAAEHIEALTFVPLEGSRGLIGKFMLYYDLPYQSSRDELELAGLIAAQVSFAVERTLDETARFDAMEESHRASRGLAAIVESSDDAIVSKNLEGIIMSWNRGAERMFGYTAEEIVGRSITVIIPTDRLAEEDMILSSVRADRPVDIETIRQRKDGTRVDISLKVSPVKDSRGRIVGVSKIARDISARKRFESERTELHRRLTALVAATGALLDSPQTEAVRSATINVARQLLVADGYAVWERESQSSVWRIVKAEGMSDTFATREIQSYRGAGVSGPLFSEPLPIEDVEHQPMVAEQLAAFRDEGIRSMLVCPMKMGERSGTLVFYYRTPHVFSDVDVHTAQALANLAAVAMTTADLYDEQRRQRDEAESARRQAAFLADATTILSRSLDYEQTLAGVARLAVPEFADWCAVDIVDGNSNVQRLAVAHVDPLKVEQPRILEPQFASSGVHEVVRTGKATIVSRITDDLLESAADDERRLALLRGPSLSSYMCVPLVSTSGTFGAMTFVFAESGRHYSERDLALAQNVAARAALAIDNAFAYRRAHEANRLKDEFLATLSHELRTPLNAILGYAQMLNMGVLSPERRTNAVTVLTRNAESLRQIIDDVLDVSRIISGKLQLKVRPIALDDILKNAIATVQPAADAKGVALRLTIDADVPQISGDPDRLQQVVWNLLSNAVKFTPQGGHVNLRLEQFNPWVQIVVSDDGQGIDPAFLPHIFERFRQGDSRFSREHGGLGLGLAIVRDLIELHGGSVSAVSEGAGTGATFTVRLLPMTPRRTSAASESSSAQIEKISTDVRLKGARILAVDDEEDALGLVRAILENAGADVTTAASGERALQLLQASGYDAMIADIGMPRMDGLQLIREIRRTLPGRPVPAAALTAYARPEDRVTALASGFQMHLAKPIDPGELVIAIAALIGR